MSLYLSQVNVVHIVGNYMSVAANLYMRDANQVCMCSYQAGLYCLYWASNHDSIVCSGAAKSLCRHLLSIKTPNAVRSVA